MQIVPEGSQFLSSLLPSLCVWTCLDWAPISTIASGSVAVSGSPVHCYAVDGVSRLSRPHCSPPPPPGAAHCRQIGRRRRRFPARSDVCCRWPPPGESAVPNTDRIPSFDWPSRLVSSRPVSSRLARRLVALRPLCGPSDRSRENAAYASHFCRQLVHIAVFYRSSALLTHSTHTIERRQRCRDMLRKITRKCNRDGHKFPEQLVIFIFSTMKKTSLFAYPWWSCII